MPIDEREVTFAASEITLHAFLTFPEGAGPFPAVVVVHEGFGLTEHIRTVARRLSAEGYVAMAVDLFTGRNRAMCMLRFLGGMMANSLAHVGIQDLKAALGFLSQQPGVDPNRLGAIGFCMGGGFAVAWACTDERLKVIAPFYGLAPRPLDAMARSCPVVGSYPAPDITTRSARKLKAALDVVQVPHDIKIYEGARHSFFDDSKASRFHPEAATDAWRRTLAFFSERIAQPRSVPTSRGERDAAGVIAPPPLLYLAAFGLGLVGDAWAGWRFSAPIAGKIVAALLVGLGLALVRWAFTTLRRAGTEASPYRATSALTAAGPFRFSRNPVYLAMTGMYVGALVLVGSVWPALMIVPLFGVMHVGVVRREEVYLARKFGAEYAQYRERVRRWL